MRLFFSPHGKKEILNIFLNTKKPVLSRVENSGKDWFFRFKKNRSNKNGAAVAAYPPSKDHKIKTAA